jgi:mycothiol system anti-sigma-R factor
MKEYCRKVLEKAYLYMDGELLGTEEREEIKVHLEECRPCYERYGLQVEVTSMVARVKGHSRCPKQLRARITALLDEA